MSVIVKGMEMPKKCLVCPFMVSRDNDDCVLQSDEANAKFNSWDDMKASCPLVEIPTPHGRLIDIKSVEYGKFTTVGNEYQRWWNGALESVIDNAPTVIEAEGSET